MAKRLSDRFPSEDGIIQYATGVTLFRSLFGNDHFRGSAEALVACGLISDDKLPGRPGRGKGYCTYKANGEMKGHSGAHSSQGDGVMIVRRTGNNRFEIQLRVNSVEAARRREVLFASSAWCEGLTGKQDGGQEACKLRLVSSGPTKRTVPPGWQVITNPHPPGCNARSI